MSDHKILLIVLGIICVILGISTIFLGVYLTESYIQKEIVPCYDDNGNRILGLTCVNERILIDGSQIVPIILGFSLGFLGTILIGLGRE